MKKDDTREKELGLTMQQKYNFDSNDFEEEDTREYRKINNYSSNSKTNKRIKEIISLKNKYKKRYQISLIVSILLLFISLFTISLYIFVKPKEIIKEVEKPVIDENIVFVGDSITDFYDLEKYYPDELNLVNSGINGNRTDDILDDMKNRIYIYNPSKVILLIGTNDISFNKSKDEIVENIKTIVKQIKKNRPYCKMYIESIYPINNTDNKKIDHFMVKNRTNSFIKKINSDLKEYAEKNDITYIDMYSDLIDEEGNLDIDYTKEGLHLSDEGYKVVTKKLKKYL